VLLAPVLVLLFAGCPPGPYAVRYQSDVKLANPLACKTRISVGLPSVMPEGLESTDLVKEIADDLVENVFPNRVYSDPDLIADVTISKLTYGSNYGWLLLSVPVWGTAAVMGVGVLTYSALGALFALAGLFPMPVATIGSEAAVVLRLRTSDGMDLRQYSEEVRATGTIISFYTGSRYSIWNQGGVTRDAIKKAMERIKRDLSIDALEIAASVEKQTTSAATQDRVLKGELMGRPKLGLFTGLIDGRSTWRGGEQAGFVVTVTNTGDDVANADVMLSGDEYLLGLFGAKRSLGEIGPGESKSEVYSLVLPGDPPEREATICVQVRERSTGASTSKMEAIKVALLKGDVSAPDLPPDPVLPTPSVFEGKRSNGHALVIGFASYQHVVAPQYSRADAEIFAVYARRVLGVANTKLVCDEQATGSTIRANLTDWMKKKHGFKVVYFAGHGVPDPENPRSGGVCVLPYDGDPELKSTLIPVSDLAELGANPDDTVVVFIDACYSGEGRTVELASRPLVLAEIPETKAITFAAAEGSQPSKEFEKAQHGYFTYYTLLGLKGKADANNDGWVTTTELYNYVKKNVSDATNEVQVPVLRPQREIRMGRVR
jgi:hypothetical protein